MNKGYANGFFKVKSDRVADDCRIILAYRSAKSVTATIL